MPGAVWLEGRAPRGAARGEVFAQGSMQGRLVVRALGRELRLRNQRRAAGAGNDFAEHAGLLQARGELAESGAKAGRQLWRIATQLSRCVVEGAGKQHAFSDGVGIDWIAGRRGTRRSGDFQGRGIAGAAAE